MVFIFYLFILLTIEIIIKKVKEFFESQTKLKKIDEIINKSNIKSVSQNYIFKIFEKKENIITSIIVIVVFRSLCLLNKLLTARNNRIKNVCF